MHILSWSNGASQRLMFYAYFQMEHKLWCRRGIRGDTWSFTDITMMIFLTLFL